MPKFPSCEDCRKEIETSLPCLAKCSSAELANISGALQFWLKQIEAYQAILAANRK